MVISCSINFRVVLEGFHYRLGFVDTERYNGNERSDVFKVLDLKQ